MEKQTKSAREILQDYRGKKIRIMEVCGTHTHEIFRLGIRGLLSPDIQLISGPGCPVCVTPVDFIDEAVYLALEKGVTICTFGDLVYDGKTKVLNPAAQDQWFTWVVSEKEGAQEYIDGFFRHYKELGVDFIRMDFLSWYEDGKDRGMGTVGRGYGREAYAHALAYIAQSAKKYGIFTSLVMPHLNNDAEVEARYGNMVRIVADTGGGGWWHTSAQDKGRSYTSWPNCMNQFDGFTYWSHITGRDKVILDGDFLRLNRYETDAERQTAVSLQLMAGGPVAVADQPSTIGGNLSFYTNDELLQLRRDGFVGQPLSNKLGDGDSEVWFGSLSNGNHVVALFNRSDQQQASSIALSRLGISGEWKVRDLWQHADEGTTSTLSATLPAHGCKVVMLTR